MFRKLTFLLVLAAAALACSPGQPAPIPTITLAPFFNTPVPLPAEADVLLSAATSETPVLEIANLVGQWWTVDFEDDSTAWLVFSMDPDGDLFFTMWDITANYCGGTPISHYVGMGTVAGDGPNRFLLSGAGFCLDTDVSMPELDLAIVYDASNDALFDSNGWPWIRFVPDS